MKVKVNYYSLEPRIFIAGTKNSYGFETLEFEFSSEWDGLNKTVTFYPSDEEAAPVALILDGKSIPIPQEIMLHTGRASFTVSGYGEDRVLVSVSGYLDVLDANDPASDLAKNPTPDYLAQLLSTAQNALDIAQSVRDDADNGAFNGENGKNGENGEKGEKGEKGDAGAGVCLGGSKGQFLVKKSDTDYDVEWKSPVKILLNTRINEWDFYDDDDHIYRYYFDLEIPEVTSSTCVDLYFHPEDLALEILCPVCMRYNGCIRIFSKEEFYGLEIPMIRIMNV